MPKKYAFLKFIISKTPPGRTAATMEPEKKAVGVPMRPEESIINRNVLCYGSVDVNNVELRAIY